MEIWPCNSTEDTGWGHTGEPTTVPCEIFSSTLNIHRSTLIIKRPKKQLNPNLSKLFDLLPLDIPSDIDIWLSVLKHRDNFKHSILRFKSMCNPFLSTTLHELRTWYYNFGDFRWYKQEK